MSRALLNGIRIANDADRAFALCGGLLADLGADVGAARGDADAVIVSGSPSALRARGVEPDGLVDADPRLIVAAITPFGLDGPRAEWRTCDTVAQALGGMLLVNGHGAEPPLRALGAQAYHCAALQAALGIVLALLARDRTGRGGVVDVSMHESVVASLEHVTGLYRERGLVAARRGTLHWSGAFRVAQCVDGPVLLSHVGDWTALLEWLKADGAAADLSNPLWADERVRREHAEHVFDVLDAWAARYRVGELVDRAALLRLPFAPVWSVEEADRQLGPVESWLQCTGTSTSVAVEPDGVAAAPVAARRAERGDGGAPRRMRVQAPRLQEHESRQYEGGEIDLTALPLHGTTVLDFTWVVAGPLATRVLADFGADVIKIERVDAHDDPARRGGRFGNLNRGKRSVAVNMDDADGRALVCELARRADVVIDNFSPRVMANWGLDAAALRAINPGAIAVSLSGFGRRGPLADRVSYGPTLQAMAGFTWHMRHPGGAPAGLGFAYADMMSGYATALATVAALWRRARGGAGAALDVAQLQVVRRLVPAPPPAAAGNRSPEDAPAPHGIYRCRDRDGGQRWCALAVFDDDEWGRVAAALRQAWTADTRFATAAGRVAHAAELDRLLEAWTRTESAEDVMLGLQAAGIAAGVVADAADLCARDPQLAARRYWASLRTDAGTVILDGVMPRLSMSSGAPRAAGPRLGEHSGEVLRELLGFEQSAVDRLREATIIR